MAEVNADDGDREAPLAASEYPISVDACLPLAPFGEKEGDPSAAPPHIDLQVQAAIPSIVRHNSIHRYALSTRTIAHYCRLEQVGEGTYGQVYRAKCLTPTLSRPSGGEMVALKKIRLHHPGYWGIPPTVIREIKILKKLQHRNLVKMFEVVTSKGVEELDWEDEWEDEKRKKEAKSDAGINSTPALADPEGADAPTGGGADASRSKKKDEITTKKKKKDPMSDLEKLRESYKGNLFLVLEYISHDLTGLLDMAHRFTEVQTKSIAKQLLSVLEFMHVRNYVHRDLKSSNVLITDRFEVKLADFGLARCLENSFPLNESYSKEGDFTNKVITLWYRPPELLLGETKYGTAVDIWSAGCILAEIILGRPIFTGKTEIDQLKLIFDLLGTPTERSWEGFRELKLIRTGEVTIDKLKRPKLREKYGSRIQPATALNLMEKLLELDPHKRFTATRALNHRYFQSDPIAPDDPKELGTIDLGGGGAGYHEFQTKKRRREAKAVAKNAEEEARKRGEPLERQKEVFDKAYRDHLKEGANADKIENKKRKQEKRPWEARNDQQHGRRIGEGMEQGKRDAKPYSDHNDDRQRRPFQSEPKHRGDDAKSHSDIKGDWQRHRVDDAPRPSKNENETYAVREDVFDQRRAMDHRSFNRPRPPREDMRTEGRGDYGRQPNSNRPGPAVSRQPRPWNREDDQSFKRSRQNPRDEMQHSNAGRMDGYERHYNDAQRPRESFQDARRGDGSAPPFAPPFRRQYDEYGNPVVNMSARGAAGSDRNQDSWSKQQDWEKGGHNSRGPMSRPPDRGPSRDEWQSEHGAHQRNGPGQDYGKDRR